MRYYRASLMALAWLLCAVPAFSQVLQLDPRAPMWGTAGYWQRLDDPAGKLDAAQASEAPGWAPLPAHLNAGFTSAAVWLRMRIDVVQPGSWMLEPSNALLDNVQLYVRHAGGSWRLLSESGEDVPRRDWPVDYRSPVFQFEPSSAGNYEVLVRLRSRNAIAIRLDWWQRLAFDNHTRREALFFGLYFGFYLLLIGVQLVFWWGTRARLSGLFLVYLSVCVLNEVLSLGLVQQITGLPGFWSDRLLGSGIACALALSAQLACGQLMLTQRYPRQVRVSLRLLWLFSIGCALSVLLGHYAGGMVPMQMLTMPLAVSLLALAAWLLWQGHSAARFFLFTFGVFYAGVLIAFLRNLGWLPMNRMTEMVSAHPSALGTMAHMVLLSVWIIGGHERRRRARERLQAQLELELAQRQLRENELSEALVLERRVHQEQRDFVAMVSHELRTPLAIISTSAQQMARNLTASPEKILMRSRNIREAAQRLLALVDGYLSDDRMRELQTAPRLAACDLRALMQELGQGFAPGRIDCIYGRGADHLVTDADLLRIALRNLLANADRHAPQGQAVQLRATRSGERLGIEVSNAAPQIPAHDQAHLFDKYYRGQNALHRPGAGLGLYLVRRIAEKLGGSIELVTVGGDQQVCLRLVLSDGRIEAT